MLVNQEPDNIPLVPIDDAAFSDRLTQLQASMSLQEAVLSVNREWCQTYHLALYMGAIEPGYMDSVDKMRLDEKRTLLRALERG